MRHAKAVVSSNYDQPVEPSRVRRRHGIVVAATVVIGAGLLRATLSEPKGSRAFAVLGLLLAATWVAGGLLGGPWPRRARHHTDIPAVEVLDAIVLGLCAFVAFLGADLIAQRIPALTHALATLLPKNDTHATTVVLAVVVANAIAEEVFFRGGLYTTLGRHNPTLFATIIYVAVTLVTLNAVLVLAAVVMGTLFSLERRSTKHVLAPAITHLTWSTLILFVLPR